MLAWKNFPYRKPLILKGVRQVGKTWILKEFGRRCYENTAYFNFDENEEYKQFFETTKDVDRILQNLMLASGQKILPEKTLIIFDEVQDCPKVINSMKYFCENAPQYHVACAGSLLGIALAKPSSFPVGKVNFMQIDPMTFAEFLLANGDENLAQYLEQVDTFEPIPDAFFNPLYEKLKMYYVTGGMPESVLMWTEARDVSAMQEALSGIIGAYERDFAKHPNLSEFPKISMIWKSIPSQLAKENKKFQLSKIEKNARNREYSGCIDWLKDAGVVSVCYCLDYPELPLKGNYDELKFKLYYPDTGLLIASLDEEAQEDLRANKNMGVYKGALYENFVAEAFLKQGLGLYYYKKENATLEEDFFVRTKDELVPVEVKANNNRSKSLRKLIDNENYSDIKWGIKLADSNVGIENGIYTFPYFCSFLIKRYLAKRG